MYWHYQAWLNVAIRTIDPGRTKYIREIHNEATKSLFYDLLWNNIEE